MGNNNGGIVVLSLFDGMSCGQIALQRLGIKAKAYYAAEIDVAAMTVAKNNFPDTIFLGDVTQVSAKNLPKIDLLLGGSPCQGFSFAGKQLAFDDPRSKLFFEYVRIWNEVKAINPTAKFLLENVKMKKKFQNIITQYMGIEPIEINSARVSAQNRKRLYWTNIATAMSDLFGTPKCIIPQPEDKGILLKDILEREVDKKYYLSPTVLQKMSFWNSTDNPLRRILDSSSPKTRALSARGEHDVHSQMTLIAENGFAKINKKMKLKTNQSKVSTICGGGHSGGNHSDMDLLLEFDAAIYQKPRGENKGGIVGGRKCPAMTSNSFQQNNLVVQLNQSSKSNSTSLDTDQRKNILVGHKIRRLTPIECERLQTVPDNYTAGVSNTQRYKMLGNGWTVDVICHILKFML